MLGIPVISGNTRYFGLPDVIFKTTLGRVSKKCQVAGGYWVPVGPWCSRGKVLCCRQKNLAGNCFCRLVQCYHRVFNMYFSTPHLRNLRYSAAIPFQNAPITSWPGHWPNTINRVRPDSSRVYLLDHIFQTFRTKTPSPPPPSLNEKINSGNTHLQDLARWWRTSKGVHIPKVSQFYWHLFEKMRFLCFSL